MTPSPPDDRAPETRYGGKTEQELRGLHEAAAPGPWTWVKAYEYRGVHWCLENEASARVGSTLNYHLVTLSAEEYEYDDDGNATRLDQTPDFAVIAAARNALPDLLSAVGTLGAALDAAEAEKKKLKLIIAGEIAYCDQEVQERSQTTSEYGQALCFHYTMTARRLRAALGREGGEEKE